MALWRIVLVFLFVVAGCVAECCAQQVAYDDYSSYARYLNSQSHYNRRMEMGIKAGVGYMNMSPTAETLSLSPKLGFSGAIAMSLVWSERYALQMEVGYLFNNVDVRLAERELELKSNIVEVPLLFSYRGLGPVRLGAGVVFSPLSSGRYLTEVEKLEFGQLRQTVGYLADVGVMLSRHLLLNLRYTGSFGTVDNYYEGLEFSTRSWWLAFNVGYMF